MSALKLSQWPVRKKVLVATFLLILIISGIGGYYVYSIYQAAQETINVTMQENLDRTSSERRVDEVDLDNSPALSFLLLGTDTEEAEQSGRSDTMIVVTVNPDEESMKMLSIPRDTLVNIPGHMEQDKINHAFAYGGSDLAMETVESFLDIPIDYVIRVNMSGFVELVDAVGGVTVENERAFRQDGYHFEEGPVSLDGDKALAFTRMRQGDPEGDLGRNRRQQQVVMGIIDEGASFSSITRVESILEGLGNNIRTNLDFDVISVLMFDYSSARHDLTTLQLEGNGTTIDGIWYLKVDEEERNRLSDALKEHLEI